MTTTCVASSTGGALLQRRSPLSGKLNKMDLPVSPERIVSWFQEPDGRLIQDAFPELTDEQREFMLTGHTQADWDKLFPPGEDGSLT